MRRLVPSILALLAVVGFMLPPAQIEHAHAGGHEAHAHGPAHVLHAALHDHSRGHSHGGSRGHAHDDGDDDECPVDDEAPEHHVHGAQAHGAIGRLRGCALGLDASSGGLVALAAVVGLTSNVAPSAPDRAATRDERDACRHHPGALDRLVLLGRLLI